MYPIYDFIERSRVHEENNRGSVIFDRILYWKYNWFVCLVSIVKGETIPTNEDVTGPQTFRPKDAPRYLPAEITIIATWGSCLIDMYFIWWWYRRENARKEKLRAEPGYTKVPNQE